MKIAYLALLGVFFGACALMLMIFATILGNSLEEELLLTAWAAFIGLWSCVFGGWAIVLESNLRERVRIEKVARQVVRTMMEEGSMPRIEPK